MTPKFQIIFSDIPGEHVSHIADLVGVTLAKNGWDTSKLSDFVVERLTYNDQCSVLFGEAKNGYEWNQRPYKPKDFTPYHPLTDWAIWSKIKYTNPDVEIKLNDSYTAIVTKDHVQVGCQKFAHAAILEVANAIKNL
jgi:hypothetical protein